MGQRSVQSKPKNSGFTLVELIVSLALFSFVITICVGALLVLLGASQREQASQAILTNLGFALDSMTREIRTGYRYQCETVGDNQVDTVFDDQDDAANINDTSTCSQGAPGLSARNTAISFVEGGSSLTGGGSARIAYIIDLNDETIYRRIGNSPARERIVSSGIRIVDGEFMVSGSDSLEDGDVDQPSVTIYLQAVDATGGTDEVFTIQTTVTQRELDL